VILQFFGRVDLHSIVVRVLDYPVILTRMPVNETTKLANTIKATLQLADRCAQTETSDNYGLLEDEVGELEGQAREAFQAQMNIPPLLSKLKKKQSLSAADLKTLELLFVGDAEYFVKYETEIDHWKSELKRLLGEIGSLQSGPADVDGVMRLRAVCQEISRILPGLIFYFDQKERAAKFEQATQGPIDSEGYKVLAETVERMLTSDKM